jgi:hypothetical protein
MFLELPEAGSRAARGGSGTSALLPAGTLDPTRLAVLTDALEEVGCTDPDTLAHLRGPGPNVRGCWVIDTLLEKG